MSDEAAFDFVEVSGEVLPSERRRARFGAHCLGVVMRITIVEESLGILADDDGVGYLRASTLSTPPTPAAVANTVADTAGAAGGSFSRAIRRRASRKKAIVWAYDVLFCRDICVAMGAALFPAASLARAFVVRLAKVAAAGLGLFVLA